MIKVLFVNNWGRSLLWLSIILFVARLLYIQYGPLDLAPDEAQYYSWLNHNSLSFTTKPPLTTWLGGISTLLFGKTVTGVKFFALISQALAGVLAFLIVQRWKGLTAAWLTFVTLHTVPLIAAGGLVMAPDVLIVTLWLWALYMLSRMDYDNPCLKPWLGVGVIIGLAGLAKYSVALFFPLLGLFLVVNKPRFLLKPHVYCAGIVALLFQLPVFIWNMQHNWVGLKHVVGQATAGRYSGLEGLGHHMMSQALIIGPIIFALFLVFAVLGWRNVRSEQKLLWWFSVPLFAGFTLLSFTTKVQANWPVLATAVGVIGAIGWVSTYRIGRSVIIAGIGLNILLSLALYDSFILRKAGVNLPIKADPTHTLQAWRELGPFLDMHVAKLPQNIPVITTRYQTMAELLFYAKSIDNILYINPGYRRRNQYDYWPWSEYPNDMPILYLTEGDNMPQVITDNLEGCGLLNKLEVKRMGLTLRTATLYHCTGGYDKLRSARTFFDTY